MSKYRGVETSNGGMKNLQEEASVFGKIFMTYLDGVFDVGFKRPLQIEDLGAIHPNDKSSFLHSKFDAAFAAHVEAKGTKATLWPILWTTVGYGQLAIGVLFFLLSAVIQFGPVLILTALVEHLEGTIHISTAVLWILVCLLFVCPMASSIALAHSNATMAHVGAQMRNMLIGAIYRKSLRLSSASKQTVSTGRIITMFSENTNQIRMFMNFICNTVVAPIQIAVCIFLLYGQVGVATFVGLGYMAFTTPVSGFVFREVNKLRRLKTEQTDMRVKLMNEILDGVRIIKYYAWEGAFIKQLTGIRNEEMRILQRMGYIFNAGLGLLMLGAPNIQTILIFFTYISLGNQLDIATAFTTITLFGILTGPFVFIPFGMQQYMTTKVGTQRIMEFLVTDELTPSIDDEKDDGIAIRMENLTMSWLTAENREAAQKARLAAVNSGDGPTIQAQDTDAAAGAAGDADAIDRNIYTLSNMNCEIKKGSLVAVIGAVGCGKSSFLSTLLGEMEKTSGSLSISTDRSYGFCDQKPWIVNANVRDNVLFGKEFDELKFNAAIYAACMTDDLKIFKDGVMTEIGERGINVSGGQKARIALARAVFSDADIYLLDDPLSAVDAHVGSHLFDKCIKEALGGKTRILVTHHVNVLPHCDHVIILENGAIKIQGSYEEILSSGVDVTHYIPQSEDKDDAAEDGEDRDRTRTMSDRRSQRGRTMSSDGGDDDDLPEGDALISKEEKREGSVQFSTYMSVINRGGFGIFAGVIAAQAVAQLLNIFSNFWLASWGQKSTDYHEAGGEMSGRSNFYHLHVFATMLMSSVACLVFGRMLLVTHRTYSGIAFHELLLKCVMSSPIGFFDVTPVGRIINRFSQDMATIDEELSQTMSQAIGTGGYCIGAIGGIIGATKGTFLIVVIPLVYLYYNLQKYYRTTNTAIARIESITRSPIYADFSQVLAGTATVRAYKIEQAYILDLEKNSDINTVPGVYQMVSGQWLAIRLDFIGAFVTFFLGALAVASQSNGFIPAGFLGLGLSYAITLTNMLKMTVRVSATTEAQMNAVERFDFYIRNLVPEGHPSYKEDKLVAKNIPETIVEGAIEVEVDEDKLPTSPVGSPPGSPIAITSPVKAEEGLEMVNVAMTVPPPDWPSVGKIEFRGVSMRYRSGPLVLKRVKFTVEGHQKIGFCGRTGCGKSSLMVALFRVEELSAGEIYIDGIDIATIGLDELRSKLCIIPQDPVMFSSSLRFNLDPFNLASDAEVWDVLREVDMHAFVSSLPDKLNEMVSEGGENFSAGQRQVNTAVYMYPYTVLSIINYYYILYICSWFVLLVPC